MASIRQTDIAARLGITQTAVAYALSDRAEYHKKLSNQTRRLVLDTARQMGYVPNRAARSLRQGQTHTIVLGTLASLRYAYTHDLVEQLELALTPHDYHLDFELLGYAKDPAAAYQSYTAGRCDGLIVMGLSDRIREQVVALRRNGRPVVSIEPGPASEFDCVCCDPAEAARLGTAHLLQQGHERIALVFDYGECVNRRMRREGYQQALREAGRPLDNALLLPWEVGVDPTGLWQQISACQPPPTALYCYNFELAAALLRTIRSRGVRVPEEMAIVADGDAQWSTLVEVPLTAIDRNHRGVALAVVERLLAQMRDPQAPPQQVLVKPFLVERASSAARTSQ